MKNIDKYSGDTCDNNRVLRVDIKLPKHSREASRYIPKNRDNKLPPYFRGGK